MSSIENENELEIPTSELNERDVTVASENVGVAEEMMTERSPNPAPTERSSATGEARPRRSKGNRSDDGKRSRPRGGKKPASFTRFVAIAWSGEREPASELIWAEASIDGEWTVIEKLERIRSRREVFERIGEMQSGLVSLDFNFSFPEPFFEILSSDGIPDWRTMVRTLREDLKKNMDDGARLWLERMGRYREAYADESAPPRRGPHDRRDRGWNFDKREKPPPYQLQSRAERFRRTDLPLVPLAGASVLSTMQIGYNRLTERYEFNGNHRGRNSLLGMAMLGQLLDSERSDLSIWPFSELKRLTIVETLPWLFTEGELLKSNELTARLANYEDTGWDIPDEAVRLASSNPAAQQALFTLIGMLKTERRMLRNRFPIRFYSPQIYTDARVQLEGWTYGINYRVSEHSDTRQQESDMEKNAESSMELAPAIASAE